MGKAPARTPPVIPLSLIAALFLFPVPSRGQDDPSFLFTFSEPEFIAGGPEGRPRFRLMARIATRDIPSNDQGAVAWSMGIVPEGCSIVDFTMAGTVSDGAEWAGEITHYARRDSTGAGVILGVILPGDAGILIPGESPHDVLALTLESDEIPADPPCITARLRYADGLQAVDGSIPVNNVVTYSVGTRTIRPLLAEKAIHLPPLACSQQEFPLDLETTLAGCKRRDCFSFNAPRGKPLLLCLTDEQPANSNALYIRWGGRPGPAEFDEAANAANRADQCLVIPAPRDETCFVLVESVALEGEETRVRLVAVQADLAIEGMSPARGGQDGEASCIILGGGFIRELTRFTLVNGGDEEIRIEARDVAIIDSGRAEVVFDLGQKPLGPYHLDAEVGLPGQSATARLEGAFEIVTIQVLQGLEVELSGRDRYRANRESRATLSYRNISDAEMVAPLFKIQAPPDTEMRLPREAVFRQGELLVLGINPTGFAGRLPPGTGNRIPIEFRSRHQVNGPPVVFEVSLHTPRREDLVDWEHLNPPAGIPDWNAVWPALSQLLGSNWKEVQENLASRATRLTRRGENGTSVLELFRFSVREARDLPGAAALGAVVEAGSGSPLSGVEVLALRGGEVISHGRTDQRGTFALDWLENGKIYQFGAAGFSETVEGLLPEKGDLYGITLAVEEPGVLPPGRPVPDETGLPGEVPLPGTFTGMARWETRIVGAIDPNKKDGPQGEPPPEDDKKPGYIGPDEPIRYTIFFENKKESAVPAKRIVILDELDARLNPESVIFEEVKIGHQIFHLDSEGEIRSQGFNIYVEGGYRPEVYLYRALDPELDVRISATIDADTRTIQWVLQAINPRTGQEPDEIDAGILPPNDEEGIGEGHVSFSVFANGQTDEHDVIGNSASIQFDGLPEIITKPRAENRYSSFLPAARPSFPSPSDGAQKIEIDSTLCWEPTDHAYCFDVYLWKEGETRPAGPTAACLKRNCYTPPERFLFETTYHWQVEARNVLMESTSGPVWTATTTPPVFRRGDSNSDGSVDISDVLSILFHYFNSRELDCLKAADADDSGELDLTDPIYLLQYLFGGGLQPASPYPECGVEETGDPLSCQVPESCRF